MMICRIAFSPTGSSGFGIEKVRGLHRVPRPPARRTAFIFSVPLSDSIRDGIVEVQMFPNPVDGHAQTLFEADFRSPSNQITRFGICRKQPHHFTFGRPESLGVMMDSHSIADEPGNQLSEASYRDFVTSAQVDLLTDGTVGLRHSKHSFNRVRHKSEITSGIRIPNANLSGGQGLRDDGWDDRTVALPRPVGVEGPDDGHRQIECMVETQCE